MGKKTSALQTSLPSDMVAFFTTSAAVVAKLYHHRTTVLSRATLSAAWRWTSKAAGMFIALDTVAKAGVCFEVFTAFLSLVDIVADALVCHEFYSGGHWVWAALVLLSLLVSTCVYVFTGSDIFRTHSVIGKSPLTDRWSKRRWNWAVLPIAQLVPTIAWATTSLHEAGLIWEGVATGAVQNTGEEKSWAEAAAACSGNALPAPPPPPTQRRPNHHRRRPNHSGLLTQAEIADAKERAELAAAAVVREQCAGASSEFAAMRRVHQEIDAYIRKHMFFFMETVVEAIPQAVIQLLAMTSIGEDPSPLQLFSMAMSLLTIATKAYLVCLTFDLKMYGFKICIAVTDLFAFFYVFATLLAPRHEDSPTFRPFWLPWGFGFVSAVWVGRSVFFVGLLASVLLFFVVPLSLYEKYHNHGYIRISRREFLDVALGTSIGIVMFAPVFFAFDALKLGWLIALDTCNLGDAVDFPQRGVQVTFIRGGKTFREQNRRLLALLQHYMARWETNNLGTMVNAAHNALEAETRELRFAEASADDGDCEPFHRRALMAVKRGFNAAVSPFPLRMLLCSDETPNGYFSEIVALVRSSLLENYGSGRIVDVIIPLVIAVVTAPYFITQAILLPLPMANYIVEEGFTFSPTHQNGFQLFCLTVWCVATLGALLLLPAAVPCVRFSLAMFPLMNREGVRPGPMDKLLAFMARTLMPEGGHVLRHTVAPAVVPALVRDFVVAPYAAGMRLGHLTAAECAALRE